MAPHTKGLLGEGEVESVDGESQASKQGDEDSNIEARDKKVITAWKNFK